MKFIVVVHKHKHTYTADGCFCRILESKKPPNTASSAVGYCSRIPQQINMYSVRLHFIPSNFTLNTFLMHNVENFLVNIIMRNYNTLSLFCIYYIKVPTSIDMTKEKPLIFVCVSTIRLPRVSYRRMRPA